MGYRRVSRGNYFFFSYPEAGYSPGFLDGERLFRLDVSGIVSLPFDVTSRKLTDGVENGSSSRVAACCEDMLGKQKYKNVFMIF